MGVRPRVPASQGGPLDAARGRSDPVERLRRCLCSAPLSYLEGALSNPALPDAGVELVLRNPRITPALIERIARDPRWNRNREVGRAIAGHPRAPLTLARRILEDLRWLDVVEISADTRLSPVLRRAAEELLICSLDEMGEGERVALARRAGRTVLAALTLSAERRVLQAVWSNPRFREPEAVRIASSPEAAPDALALLSEHPAWGSRHAVRIALVLNPRTPVPSALRVLSRLSRRDLERLSRDSRAPRIVGVGASRLLERGRGAAAPDESRP